MKVAVLLDKLNFHSEVTKAETEALISYLSSISNLELFVHKKVNKDDLHILRKNINKQVKLNYISIPSLLKLYLNFDYIFTTSNKNLVTSLFAHLPRKNYWMYIQIPKICEIDKHLLKNNEFDVVLHIDDLFLNLQLLEKVINEQSNSGISSVKQMLQTHC